MRQTRSFARFTALITLLGVFVITGCNYSPYAPPPLAFSGDSASAKETVVVPTLDAPVSKGKNVIWCATFQLCWDELKPVVGPIDVPGAQDTIRRLDASRINVADLPKGGYYAAAGLAKDGIVKKIQSDMAAKFPNVKPNLPAAGSAEAVAYAYLKDAVKFHTPYFDREGGDDFIDSAGNKARIASFGLYESDHRGGADGAVRRQIEVLYSDTCQDPLREFVLDLDKNSQPTQLILACVEPKSSLAATWHDVQGKIANWKPADGERNFGGGDSLAVPDLNYKVRHSFKELETSGFLGTSQTTEFRLDRSGATMTSEAYTFTHDGWAVVRSFRFTRPFMIAMRKRGSAEPYFVMWVDNAELLCKQGVH